MLFPMLNILCFYISTASCTTFSLLLGSSFAFKNFCRRYGNCADNFAQQCQSSCSRVPTQLWSKRFVVSCTCDVVYRNRCGIEISPNCIFRDNRNLTNYFTVPKHFFCIWKPSYATALCNKPHTVRIFLNFVIYEKNKGHAVAQLVEVLLYKPEGRGFNPRCCHWNVLLI
jgi:hypothetical protein